jgi:hypothetical protein
MENGPGGTASLATGRPLMNTSTVDGTTGLAARGEQRRRDERRLCREVGAELHAAEADGVSPCARCADPVADPQSDEPLRHVAGPGRIQASGAAPLELVAREHRIRNDTGCAK